MRVPLYLYNAVSGATLAVRDGVCEERSGQPPGGGGGSQVAAGRSSSPRGDTVCVRRVTGRNTAVYRALVDRDPRQRAIEVRTFRQVVLANKWA